MFSVAKSNPKSNNIILYWRSIIFLVLLNIAYLFIFYIIYYDIYNFESNIKGLSLIFKKIPQINPRKAAILLYKLNDEKEIDKLSHKAVEKLRNTLVDPRSFLVKSYGTHFGRNDYINAPAYIE
nr:MAG: wsv136-like protein [Metapenaeopsis lamellata majanivirus]